MSRDARFTFVLQKPRLRRHKKSRQGCFACKGRRVKCLEQRPTCVNCLRLALTCEYEDQHAVIPRCRVGDAIEPQDRELRAHFVVNFADPRGVLYHSEIAGTWLQDIPARSMRYPAMLSAIMACASSHLAHETKAIEVRTSLLHRSRALSQLSQMVSALTTPSTPEGHAVIATCIILRMQSLFLDDGFLEWLTLRRLTFHLTANVSERSRSDSTNRVGWQDMHGNVNWKRPTTVKLDQRIMRSAARSLSLLQPLIPEGEAETYLYHLLVSCVDHFQQSTLLGMKSFETIYLALLQMPECHLQGLLKDMRPVARVLLGHFIAIHVIVTVLTSSKTVDNQHRSMGKVKKWIESLCGDLENSGEWHRYVAWPLLTARAGEGEPYYGRLSMRDFLSILEQEPKAFCLRSELSSCAGLENDLDSV